MEMPSFVLQSSCYFFSMEQCFLDHSKGDVGPVPRNG